MESNAPISFLFGKQTNLLVKGLILWPIFIDKMKIESIWLFFYISNVNWASLVWITASPAAAIFRIHARNNVTQRETHTWNKWKGRHFEQHGTAGLRYMSIGSFLAVKTPPSKVGSAGLIPAWGSKFPHTIGCGQKKKKKKWISVKGEGI